MRSCARKNLQVLRPYNEEESCAYQAIRAATAGAAATSAAATTTTGMFSGFNPLGRGASSTVEAAAAATEVAQQCKFVFFAPELVSAM